MKHWWQIILGLALVLASAASAEIREPAPLIEPDAGLLRLDDIGMYAVGYAYRGQPEQSFPKGWSGGFDDVTGVALQSGAVQNGRLTCLLHPPWRGGTGVAFQEFRFHLPPAGHLQHIRLVGATAMRLDALAGPGEKPKSDGATFRILANGRTLLDEHRQDTTWKEFAFDLTSMAGQTVTVRFETDPGPRNDASFDFALWGGRELVLEGFVPPSVIATPPPPPLDLRRLYPVQNDEVAPPSGFAGELTTMVAGDQAILTYHGPDGTLAYEWTRPMPSSDAPLGRWHLEATPHGSTRSTEIPLAGDARLEWTQPAVFQASHWETVPDGAACVSTYEVGGHPATLRCTATLSGKSLVLDVRGDEPQVTAFQAGRWGPVLHRQPVTVPYYSGQIFYLGAEHLFVNTFLDWTKSAASALDNNRAIYGARIDGNRVPLHERVVFSAAWHLAETLPNIPNPPSPFREHLGDRIVLDIWGGQFADIARHLETLHDYGLDHCLAIIHDWQRSGYDNALPAHVPANAKLGGEPAMKQLVATAKSLGYDLALHENYVDYYPNYEGFNEDDISLDGQGQRVPAWFNPGTKIQSFAIQPHAMLPLARTQSSQILARYAPNADYLDVHSAVPPWFHVDYRATAAGSAQFQTVREAHRQLWAFERETYHGPVLGEGANHWYWSGLLDGVEAQLSVGWPGNSGQTAPLMVDFDLLKIHPLQFNHGMGYYERWWNAPAWGGLPPMAVLDQYRMQEVIYGHAGFLGGAAWSNVPLAWLEHHLLSPVTARYATARPVTIEYQVKERWGDSSQAALTGDWERVRVTYDNGLIVTANKSVEPLPTEDAMLPQSGWCAAGAGVTAWTALRQGVIADYAHTADSTFANARPAVDWNQSGIHHIRPAIAEFRPTGNRAFALTYEWHVGETLPLDYTCFVHFVNGGKISFQDDHAVPSSTWKMGTTLSDGPHEIHLPDGLADGDYDVCLGLYRPEVGRLALQGRNDGENRIEVGTVSVRDAGATLTFVPALPAQNDGDDIYQQRLNAGNQVLDFGDVRTDGSVLVRREAGEWVLRPLPRTRNFTIALSSARFGHPTTLRCVGGSAPTVTPVLAGDWWQLPLNGAREYHWQ